MDGTTVTCAVIGSDTTLVFVTIWDKLRAVLKSEGADVSDELGKARDKLDEALTRKEQEMAATPKERMDMILDDIGDSDSEFDRILDKAEGKTSQATAEAEVAETVRATVKSESPASAEPDEPSAEPEGSAAEPLPPATAEAIAAAEPDTSTADTGAATARPADTTNTSEISAAVDSDDGPSVDEMVERRIELDSRRAAADAKFEAQKERAGDILDELRGELGIDD